MQINGDWVRKYELEHTLGDNESRMMLESVTETVKDIEGNELTRPATSFTYQDGIDSWTRVEDDWWWGLTGRTGHLGAFNGNYLIDLNGDGLKDSFYSTEVEFEGELAPPSTSFAELRPRGGWDIYDHDIYEDGPGFFLGVNDRGVVLGDYNGDGFIDIYKNYIHYSSFWWDEYEEDGGIYIHNGDDTGWTQAGDILDYVGLPSVSGYPAHAINHYYRGVKAIEVNGVWSELSSYFTGR